MTIKTQLTSALSKATRDAVVQLCTAAHEIDFGPLFSYLPPDGLHLFGYIDGELISHAVVTTRWLQPEDMDLLRTAYVDAVATKPAWQGQGHGSAVMRRLAKDYFQRLISVASLFCVCHAHPRWTWTPC